MIKKSLILSPFIFFVSIWSFSLLLYSVTISKLIHFDIVFFIIVSSFIMFFILLMLIFSKKYLYIDLNNLKNALVKNYKVYKKFFYILFFLGSIGCGLEIYLYHEYIPIFLQNKINSGTKNHHIHYLTQFSMYASLIGIGLYIFTKRKFFIFIIFLIFLELIIWLKRGEILPIIVAFIIYFYIKSLLNNNLKKFYIIGIIFVIIFIMIFSIVGYLRMEYVLQNIFHQTYNQRYLLPEWMPHGFNEIYIYIATTLENVRYIILEENINNYTYGTLLIYPFLAIFAKSILVVDYYPYLAKSYGLTVVSFMGDAYSDFGIIGVYIYTFIYFFIAYIGFKFINRGLFGISVFIFSELFIFWSFFTNSIKNGVFMIGFIIFIILSLKYERFKYENFNYIS